MLGHQPSLEAELGKLLDDVNHPLVSHERLRMLVVAREPWTIENGQLTPTMKINPAASRCRSARKLKRGMSKAAWCFGSELNTKSVSFGP